MQLPDIQSEKNSQMLQRLQIVMQKQDIKSNKSLADKLDMSPSYISEMFNGNKKIPKTLSNRLEDVLRISRKWFEDGEGEIYLSGSKDTSIPYYNVEATAGNLNLFNDEPELPDYQIKIPGFDDCDFALNLAGHSMYPRFYSGDIIVCKRLRNLEVVPLGETYLIITDEQRLVKYIKKGSTLEYYTLASENPKYEAFEIKKEYIKMLYIVKGKIERNQI